MRQSRATLPATSRREETSTSASRINGTRRYRRRFKRPRSKIPGRVDITERPSSVEARTYYGDWEIDLVEGKKGTGFILSMVERKSRYSLFERMTDKRASTVAKAMIRRLRPFKTRTLTYDNGLEFAQHLEVGCELGAKSYFCAPYHAWEKGLVENHNGLLRQYYPKGESFAGIKEDSLRWVKEEINERPRKLWSSPKKVDMDRTDRSVSLGVFSEFESVD